MGLNSRGNGRGGGNIGNFRGKCRYRGKIMGPKPLRPAPPGAFHPSAGYFGRYDFNFGQPRPVFNKYTPIYFKDKYVEKSNDFLEIDLTKPWVTEKIKIEELKKQKLLQLFEVTQKNDDQNKFLAQNHLVQLLYEKSKSDYASAHPNEAVFWENTSTAKQYYCETCDKSFRNHEGLMAHEAEHETCGRDGCDFTAHPKIIAKHIKMQHATGLYKRIGKLYTQEDIAKWIEERKKRYPTRKVVEEKKALEQEKFNRGERIKNDDCKFNKLFRSKNRGAKRKFEKRKKSTAKNHRRKKNKKNVEQICVKEEDLAVRKGVPAFLGIKSELKLEAPDENNFNISDEEWEIKQSDTKPLLNNSLGLLATLYDSDEENQNQNLNQEVKVGVISTDEESGPEEVKTVTSRNISPKEESFASKKLLNAKRKNIRQKRQKPFNDSIIEKKEKRVTLLEKLLKSEIRHERNVILQCVHYVIKNNFFRT